MSILSDYQRHVENPRIAGLEATIKALRAELARVAPLAEAARAYERWVQSDKIAGEAIVVNELRRTARTFASQDEAR